MGGEDDAATPGPGHPGEHRGHPEAAGATFADVLKVIVYLTNIGDRAAINPAHQEFFGDSRPCSTLVGIKTSLVVLPGVKGRNRGPRWHQLLTLLPATGCADHAGFSVPGCGG